jgi:hypothetical protein
MAGTYQVICSEFPQSWAANHALPSIRKGKVIVVRDNLSIGPLVPADAFAGWDALRGAFWESVHGERKRPRRRRHGAGQMETVIHGDVQALAMADEIVVLAAAGLSEQLTLAWMPWLLRSLGGRPETLHVIQFEYRSNGKLLPCMEVINEDDFLAAPPPRRLEAGEIAYLDRAWQSVTSCDPSGLLELLAEPDPRLPILQRAFRRLLWHYPGQKTGLDRYQERLLRWSSSTPQKAAAVVAAAIQDQWVEVGDFTGDIWLFWMMTKLADPSLPHPALELTGDLASVAWTQVRLTSAGEKFLAGDWNFVERNGIDRWVGGVQLDSRAGTLWYRIDDGLVKDK